MTITQAVLGFGTVAVLLTLIPGLDTTLALRTALVKGRRHGFLAVLGINLGLLTWGAAALLAASETAYRLLTVAGALYMAYLGVMMIVKSFRGTEQDTDAPAATSASGLRSFLVGFWTNLLNPKIGVFYIATIPQFIPADASPLGMGVLLASIHAVLGLAWLGFIVTGASAARRWLSSARALRIIDRVAGTVLVGFGAKLAFDARA